MSQTLSSFGACVLSFVKNIWKRIAAFFALVMHQIVCTLYTARNIVRSLAPKNDKQKRELFILLTLFALYMLLVGWKRALVTVVYILLYFMVISMVMRPKYQ